MLPLYIYILIFMISFTVSLLTAPLAKKIAIKLGAIDVPKERGLNKVPKPRMGGLSIICGFFTSLLFAIFFEPELHSRQFFGFVVGAIIIIIVGMFDDVKPLRAKVKFVIQIMVALIVMASGTVISFITIPFLNHIPYLNYIVTVVWIVGLINAVNLIDGIDGLAAGVTAISSSALFLLCLLSGSTLAVIFTAALAGSSLGFLPRNFSPSEVIMGDTGSTFLGYVLAVSSIIGVFKGYALISVLIAVLIFALPILDTSFAMLRRIYEGRSIMSADRGHFHHRLVDYGFSHKTTVIILYALTLLSCTVAVSIAVQNMISAIIIVSLGFVLLIMVLSYAGRMQRKDIDPEMQKIIEKADAASEASEIKEVTEVEKTNDLDN